MRGPSFAMHNPPERVRCVSIHIMHTSEKAWCILRLLTGWTWQKPIQEQRAQTQLLRRAIEEANTRWETRKRFVCHKQHLITVAWTLLAHIRLIMLSNCVLNLVQKCMFYPTPSRDSGCTHTYSESLPGCNISYASSTIDVRNRCAGLELLLRINSRTW